MMEARLVFDGEETVLGLPAAAVPGETLRDKRQFVYSATGADLMELVKKGGWYVKHDQTALLIIPTGFICVFFTTSSTFGIRWSISSDATDTLRAKHMLTNMLNSFPELKGPSLGMASCLNYLETESA